MTSSNIEDALREMRFASGLSDEDMQKLAAISSWIEFPTNTTIFTEGDQADFLYLIAGGRVELGMNIPGEGLTPILTLEDGDLLGGSPALFRGEMTMTATTILETRALKIDASHLRVLCEEDHDIGYEVMKRVALALLNRLVATRLQVLDVHRDSMLVDSRESKESRS